MPKITISPSGRESFIPVEIEVDPVDLLNALTALWGSGMSHKQEAKKIKEGESPWKDPMNSEERIGKKLLEMADEFKKIGDETYDHTVYKAH